MTKLLDPKNDVVFQKIFGMKNHKKILISFLNSILNLTNMPTDGPDRRFMAIGKYEIKSK